MRADRSCNNAGDKGTATLSNLLSGYCFSCFAAACGVYRLCFKVRAPPSFCPVPGEAVASSTVAKQNAASQHAPANVNACPQQ